MHPSLQLVERAARQIGVKEFPLYSNKGKSVEVYQKAVDGIAQSEAWCMCMVQFLVQKIEALNKIQSDLFPSEHCLTVWNRSPKSMRVDKPRAGDIVIWRHGKSFSGHTGIVEGVTKDYLTVIEGNTNDNGAREGDGVYRKKRKHTGDGNLKVVGFLRPFP
jgi:hypothetical protein